MSRERAESLANEGINLYRRDCLREALRSYTETLAICRELRDQAWEGTTLNNLGLVYHSLVLCQV